MTSGERSQAADGGGVDPRHLGHGASSSSILGLLLLAPLTVLCLLPLTLVAAAVLPGGVGLWTIVYFAALPLLLVPGLEFVQARLVCPGSRRPTTDESARLTARRDRVLARVAADKRPRHRFRVSDDDRPTARAGGGCMVVVTARALNELPDDQLEAVLAHQLGHQVGARPFMALAHRWLVQPVEWAARVLAAGQSLLAWLDRRRMQRNQPDDETGGFRRGRHRHDPDGPRQRRRLRRSRRPAVDEGTGRRRGRRRAGPEADQGRPARRPSSAWRLLRWAWVMLGRACVLLIRLALLVLEAVVRIASLVSRFVGRRAEYGADAVAVRLGYGPDLLAALASAENQDAADDDSEAAPRAVSPFRDARAPVSARVARIRDSIASL